MIKKTMIIAEAGVNHNGNIDLAYKLIDAAKNAGADYVKFQTFKAAKLVTKKAGLADYQKKTTSDSQFDMLKKLELSDDDHLKLAKYCKEKQIQFLSTPFDEESAEFLFKMGVDFFKIPSGEATNLPFLEFIGKFQHKVVLSTGMCTLEEVMAARDVLIKAGTQAQNITVLHCNTEYPTPFEDVHLNVLKTFKEHFEKIGYSDHTDGIEIAIAAVALGAEVIEKHFTLDKTMPGPDHKASLEPQELKQMVLSIRNIEKALGRRDKKPSASEEKNITIARKSIVAKKQIKKGEKFSLDNLTTKRPGSGISPMKWHQILGTAAAKDYNEDDLI